MKIIYNITKMNEHRTDKNGLPVGTYGAIIFYGEDKWYGKDKWFVDLELKEDREKFDKFVAETSDEDKWSWEDTLHSMLCVEDVNTAWYKYYVDDITEERPYGSKCINAELEVRYEYKICSFKQGKRKQISLFRFTGRCETSGIGISV